MPDDVFELFVRPHMIKQSTFWYFYSIIAIGRLAELQQILLKLNKHANIFTRKIIIGHRNEGRSAIRRNICKFNHPTYSFFYFERW